MDMRYWMDWQTVRFISVWNNICIYMFKKEVKDLPTQSTMLGCSWYPLQEHAQWKEPTVFTQRSWQPPLFPSLHSFRSRYCMEHNYACSYIENRKVLSTVNQLLIMCKKFFRGLRDILWREHFSPRTSPPMSRILRCQLFSSSSWKLVAINQFFTC